MGALFQVQFQQCLQEAQNTDYNIISEVLLRTNKNINDVVIGVYSVSSKSGSDNTRFAALTDVVNILKETGINILIFEKDKYNDEEFYQKCDLIIVNRYSDAPKSFMNKIYTRDVFFNN